MKTFYETPEAKSIDVSAPVRDMLLKWDEKQLKTEILTFEKYPHDPWKRYAYFMRDDIQVLYDDNQLEIISNFIKMLMILRKIEKGNTT